MFWHSARGGKGRHQQGQPPAAGICMCVYVFMCVCVCVCIYVCVCKGKSKARSHTACGYAPVPHTPQPPRVVLLTTRPLLPPNPPHYIAPHHIPITSPLRVSPPPPAAPRHGVQSALYDIAVHGDYAGSSSVHNGHAGNGNGHTGAGGNGFPLGAAAAYAAGSHPLERLLRSLPPPPPPRQGADSRQRRRSGFGGFLDGFRSSFGRSPSSRLQVGWTVGDFGKGCGSGR
mgnify:CR=1 FL=1